ncbi:MAG TPA: FAD:protein FMN transferase [Gaiellaceae bacterium]|nr:FAD:protein FMN transferase [Gaiellaceae bacterium]
MDTFRSMGCDVACEVDDAAAVRQRFEDRDARFSRFRVRSELNAVNATRSAVVCVSAPFADMLGVALAAARATAGLVTPAVGGAVLAAGYDRDFDELPGDRPDVPAPAVPSFRSLSLRGRLLVRGERVLLDLNGVVKGKTVDDALAEAGGGWVSAGGDIATTVPVRVGLPGGETIVLTGGGLATSSVAVRRWRRGGAERHHLIDPATGRPADSPWRDVSAVAGSCLAADVAAKAALLLGPAGPAWLDRRGLAGRFVTRGGRVVVNEAWRQSLGIPLELAA